MQFGAYFISWDTVLLSLLLTTMHWEIANVHSGRTARRVMGFKGVRGVRGFMGVAPQLYSQYDVSLDNLTVREIHKDPI